MANLPQVLDQNYVMGANIAEPILSILQVSCYIHNIILDLITDLMLHYHNFTTKVNTSTV